LKTASTDEVVERARWPYISLIPIGLGAWAPIYAGVRARKRVWILLGIISSALVVGGFLADSLGHHHGDDDFAGFLLIAGWVSAVATSFSIRAQYERTISSPLGAAATASEARLRERDEARRIVEQNPPLAREMGVGRPDQPGAFTAGLIDVNNAPAHSLQMLPGIDDALATRITETRAQTNGFSSVEDLGTVLDLPSDLVDRLRDRAVFLPR
jgi:DNA uptake protein ComE-like DNA-binding protein